MNRLRKSADGLVSGSQGQAAVEMAVALPLLLLLLCGFYSLAMVLFGWCNITIASRTAVRYASVHSNTSFVPATNASVIAVVTPYLIAVTPGNSTTTVTYSPLNTIGSTVKVKVVATYSVVMPFTTYSSFTLASTAQRTITR